MKKETINKLMYLLLIFVIGSFIGWIYEEIFYLIYEGKLVNRGVLFGPWLPIYGVGCVFLYYLKPLKRNPLLLFLACVVVTGIVEYIIGWIGINIFNMRLWDYRGLFLNINGIVCLRSVVTFGIGGLLFHYLLEPFIEKLFKKHSYKKEKIVSVVFIVLLLLDVVLSVLYRNPILY